MSYLIVGGDHLGSIKNNLKGGRDEEMTEYEDSFDKNNVEPDNKCNFSECNCSECNCNQKENCSCKKNVLFQFEI